MILNTLHFLFNRDLDRLSEEINLYKDEKHLWIINGTIKNSGGNLSLHLCGNLCHFIGHLLGGSNYVRQRDAEFSSRNIPKIDLLSQIDETKTIVLKTIKNLTSNQLENSFPQQVFKEEFSTAKMLFHLHGHLNYHLGQINYHRRLLAEKV